MSVAQFLTDQEQEQIVAAIQEAENNTSGEIRVHIDDKCKEDVLDRAAYLFEKLEMHKTDLRNGVLFYLAHEDRKFAILGDAGINRKVQPGFWDEIKEMMATHFKNSEFVEGLSKGVLMAGEQLKKYFPCQSDDVNELSDEITFGKQ